MPLSLVNSAPAIAQEKSPWQQYRDGVALIERAPSIIGFPKDVLYSATRVSAVAQPRQIVMLALHRLGLRWQQIALLTGREHHATAMAGVKSAKRLIKRYPEYAELLTALEDSQ
jgi:hypothetical protein